MYKVGVVVLVILAYVCIQYFVEASNPCSIFGFNTKSCNSDRMQ